jgi:Major Facilitator Superfamily/Probable cobalt transporter subunit (CbtA)
MVAMTTGSLLWRGMIVGFVAALLSFGLLKTVGEPAVDRAIAFESAMDEAKAKAEHDAAVARGENPPPVEEEPELVSRAVQGGIGLFPTYAMTLRGGSLFRVSVTMAPFLLPTMFQLGFGLNPFASGLLILPLFAGSLGMKIITTRLLRRYGFRRVLLVNGTLTALAVVGCAALTPSTPYTVIVIVLFASGLTRSLQFSALNSLAFADVPPEQMSATNTWRTSSSS